MIFKRELSEIDILTWEKSEKNEAGGREEKRRGATEVAGEVDRAQGGKMEDGGGRGVLSRRRAALKCNVKKKEEEKKQAWRLLIALAFRGDCACRDGANAL